MFKLPTNREWYEKLILLEGDHEVSAGNVNPKLDGVAGRKKQAASTDIDAERTSYASDARLAFARVVRELRLDKRLSYAQLSKRVAVDVEELKNIEDDTNYRAAPRTLVQLADFYSIPSNQFLALAGAIRNPKIEQEAVKFAAQSASYDELTHEQRTILHGFVRFLQEQATSSCKKQ